MISLLLVTALLSNAPAAARQAPLSPEPPAPAPEPSDPPPPRPGTSSAGQQGPPLPFGLELRPADPLLRGFNLPLPRAAAQAPAALGTYLSEALWAFAADPFDLAFVGRLGYRMPIYATGSLLLGPNELVVGVAPRVSLRGFGFGPFIEIQPTAFFHLRVSAELFHLFGWLGSARSYLSPGAGYWHVAETYPTGGGHLQLQPTLQARVGPVSVRNHLSLDFWNVAIRATDRVFYEVSADTLVPRKGWVLSNTLDFTYEVDRTLTAGLRYVLTAPLYSPRDFGGPVGSGAEQRASENGHMRLGAIGTFAPGQLAVWGLRPVLAADLAFWLTHRYRAGAQASRLVPRLWLGVAVPFAAPAEQVAPQAPSRPTAAD